MKNSKKDEIFREKRRETKKKGAKRKRLRHSLDKLFSRGNRGGGIGEVQIGPHSRKTRHWGEKNGT